MDMKIAQLLYSAQYASDCAKDIYRLNEEYVLSSRNICKYSGYYYKDIFIAKAINEICKSRGNTNFSFYVCRDLEGIAKYLVYFNAKLNEIKYQVSFHSFDDSLTRFITKRNIHKTKWDKKVSNEACENIIRYYYE